MSAAAWELGHAVSGRITRALQPLVIALVNDLIPAHDDAVETVPDLVRPQPRIQPPPDLVPLPCAPGHVDRPADIVVALESLPEQAIP